MKTKQSWRRGGLAIAEIMALLLLVLPTMAFIVTFIIDYWSVMRIDNNLKLITNMATTRLNNKTDLSGPIDDALLESKLSSFCPKDTEIILSREGDGAGAGYIEVSASYTYNGTYLKDKNLVARMTTYSYHDQNATIKLECK